MNPYAELTEGQHRTARRQLLSQAKLQRHFQRVAEQYRDLLTAPAYTELHKEVVDVLAEQLTLLVTRASTCPACCPTALHIKLLQQIVAAPLATLYYDRQMRSLEDDDRADE